MKDIKINTLFMKIQYLISWTGFIIFGFIIGWLIAIGLYSYGKNTKENTHKQKGLINMTYQKFILIYGGIIGDLFILGLMIDLILFIFTGRPMQ